MENLKMHCTVTEFVPPLVQRSDVCLEFHEMTNDDPTFISEVTMGNEIWVYGYKILKKQTFLYLQSVLQSFVTILGYKKKPKNMYAENNNNGSNVYQYTSDIHIQFQYEAELLNKQTKHVCVCERERRLLIHNNKTDLTVKGIKYINILDYDKSHEDKLRTIHIHI